MNRNKGHIPKSKQERAAYVNYIRKLDYEPTKDEALDFSESSDKAADYSIEKANKVKRLTTWEQFQFHFEENWIKWLIAGVVVIISFFAVSSQVSISGLNIKQDQSDKEIEIINTDLKEIKSTNHNQDMKIQKNEIMIENLKENQKDTK